MTQDNTNTTEQNKKVVFVVRAMGQGRGKTTAFQFMVAFKKSKDPKRYASSWFRITDRGRNELRITERESIKQAYEHTKHHSEGIEYVDISAGGRINPLKGGNLFNVRKKTNEELVNNALKQIDEYAEAHGLNLEETAIVGFSRGAYITTALAKERTFGAAFAVEPVKSAREHIKAAAGVISKIISERYLEYTPLFMSGSFINPTLFK